MAVTKEVKIRVTAEDATAAGLNSAKKRLGSIAQAGGPASVPFANRVFTNSERIGKTLGGGPNALTGEMWAAVNQARGLGETVHKSFKEGMKKSSKGAASGGDDFMGSLGLQGGIKAFAAAAGVKFFGQMMAKSGESMKELADEIHRGKQNGDQLALSFAKSIPIVGTLFDGEVKMLDGLADLTAEVFNLGDAWLSTGTKAERVKEIFGELAVMRGMLGQSTGTRDDAKFRELFAGTDDPDKLNELKNRQQANEDGKKIKAMRDEQSDLAAKVAAKIATPDEKSRLSFLNNNIDVDERALARAREAEAKKRDRDRMKEESDRAEKEHKDMLRQEREDRKDELQGELDRAEEAKRLVEEQGKGISTNARFASGDFSIGGGSANAIRELTQNNPLVQANEALKKTIEKQIEQNKELIRQTQRLLDGRGGESLFGDLN